jgi:hypothetical protein
MPLPLDETMQRCIDHCLACYRLCLETWTGHCLEQGGEHVQPEHARLMLNCAQLCQAAAALMLGRSPLHARQCELCAEACENCAESCEELGDMAACAEACRRCAGSCREMARADPL